MFGDDTATAAAALVGSRSRIGWPTSCWTPSCVSRSGRSVVAT